MTDRYSPDSPEEWRAIPGWPEYQASSHGRIASVKRGKFRVLSGGKTDMGYRNVLLYRKGDRVGRRVHQLVALTFHGPRPEGLEIRHLDGDKMNNAASNLAYGTREENLEDQRRHRGLLLLVGPDPVPYWASEEATSRVRLLKPFCRNGHEYTPKTERFTNTGRRFCLPCASAAQVKSRRLRMARRRAAAAGIEVAA